MQNLPFLATQVPAAQNATQQAVLKNQSTQNGQKQAEPNTSFKQILSKQSGEPSSKAAAAHEVNQQRKLQKSTSNVQQNRGTQHTQTQYSQHANQHERVGKDHDIDSVAEVSEADAALVEIDLASTLFKTQAKSVTLAETAVAEDKTGVTPMLTGIETVQSLLNPVMANVQTVPVSSTSANSTGAVGDEQQQLSGQKLAGVDEHGSQQLDIGQGAKSLTSMTQYATTESATSTLHQAFAAKLADKQLAEADTKTLPQTATPAIAGNVIQMAQQVAVAQTQQLGSSNVIQAYPGKTGWDQAIGQKVVWMVSAEVKSATLTLNPPDLGPLQVVISVNNDKADTTFISDNADVRKALENGISTLRDYMDQAGVQLGQANVNSGKQQQEFQQASKEQGFAKQANSSMADKHENSGQAVVTPAVTRVSNGLVDTFA